MGFFSWKTSDTDKSVSNSYSSRGVFTVYLLDNKGNKYREDNYEGYGVFGGKDAYQLVAEMNCPEKCTGDIEHDRLIGIELSFGKEGQEVNPDYPIKIVESSEIGYDQVNESESCPDQGYFYDDCEHCGEHDRECTCIYNTCDECNQHNDYCECEMADEKEEVY